MLKRLNSSFVILQVRQLGSESLASEQPTFPVCQLAPQIGQSSVNLAVLWQMRFTLLGGRIAKMLHLGCEVPVFRTCIANSRDKTGGKVRCYAEKRGRMPCGFQDSKRQSTGIGGLGAWGLGGLGAWGLGGLGAWGLGQEAAQASPSGTARQRLWRRVSLVVL